MSESDSGVVDPEVPLCPECDDGELVQRWELPICPACDWTGWGPDE